jgi:hypothetical protein
MCGEWCKLHWLLLEIPTFDWNTRRSRGHKIFKMAPTKQPGPKEKFLKKVQSFSDTLYYNSCHNILNDQQDATVKNDLLFRGCSTCFERHFRSSSGASKLYYTFCYYTRMSQPACIMGVLELKKWKSWDWDAASKLKGQILTFKNHASYI